MGEALRGLRDFLAPEAQAQQGIRVPSMVQQALQTPAEMGGPNVADILQAGPQAEQSQMVGGYQPAPVDRYLPLIGAFGGLFDKGIGAGLAGYVHGRMGQQELQAGTAATGGRLMLGQMELAQRERLAQQENATRLAIAGMRGPSGTGNPIILGAMNLAREAGEQNPEDYATFSRYIVPAIRQIARTRTEESATVWREGQENDRADWIVDQMDKGLLPPEWSGLTRTMASLVAFKAAQRNLNLAQRQLQWRSFVKFYQEMNDSDARKTREGLNTIFGQLPILEQRIAEWKQMGGMYGYPLLNKASLLKAVNDKGPMGGVARSLNQLISADIVPQIAKIYGGGDAATEGRLKQAESTLQSDFNEDQFREAIKTLRDVIQVRWTAMNKQVPFTPETAGLGVGYMYEPGFNREKYMGAPAGSGGGYQGDPGSGYYRGPLRGSRPPSSGDPEIDQLLDQYENDVTQP